jgi:hypothetical protein
MSTSVPASKRHKTEPLMRFERPREGRLDRPEERVVTAAIWTVHFGLDGRMWESQRRMADFMRDSQLAVASHDTMVVRLEQSCAGKVINVRTAYRSKRRYRPEERVVTAAIWTVHFGLDGRMWESQRRMADFERAGEQEAQD